MQNLAYSLWTRPRASPLSIGRIGGIGDLGRSCWRIFPVSADGGWCFSIVGVVVGVAAALGLEGPQWFLLEHRKCTSRLTLYIGCIPKFDTPLLFTGRKGGGIA
jgi:hypothetical protein